MRFRSLAALSVACAVFGCAGGATPRPTNGHETRVTTAPEQNEPENARRPSAAIAKRWPFRRPPTFSLYADVAGFTRTEVFRTFATSAMLMARGQVDLEQSTCIRALLDGARELAFGYEMEGDEGIVVMSHRPELRERAGDCLRRFGAQAGPALAGARETHVLGNNVIAFADSDVVLYGSKSRVAEALAGHSSAGPALGLAPDEYVTWSGAFPELGVTGSLACSDERFALSVVLEAKDERLASQLGTMAEQSKQKVAEIGGAEERALAQHLLDALKIQRDDNRFTISFELLKPPEEQAKDLGMAAALAIHGVRRYISRAKQAEAKNALGAIARDYVSWWEREELTPTLAAPPKRKKLFSLIPVPTQVPSGKKYQTAEGEWKAWQNIRFSMSNPQYYQYEVKAAKDGKSADIIARGDLDGDGKPSTFTLRLKVDQKINALVIGKEIEEVDPDE